MSGPTVSGQLTAISIQLVIICAVLGGILGFVAMIALRGRR